jgi:hypothetical protein
MKKEQEKIEKMKLRRQRAREIAYQRRKERQEIHGWERQESLVSVNEDEEMSQADLSVVSKLRPQDDEVSEVNSYDQRRLAAKQQLVDEIRLANEAKMEEMERLTKERLERREQLSLHRPASAHSIGSIDTNELMSFDEGDGISISGLSQVKQNENKGEANRKAQAALALAELDIKLTEIQLMQAILLAEEASLSGKSEFKTTEQMEDLKKVEVFDELFREKTSKSIVKERAKSFFSSTMKQAKRAKERTGRTLADIKAKMEKVDHQRRQSKTKA